MMIEPLGSLPRVQAVLRRTWLGRRIGLMLWRWGGNHNRGYFEPFPISDADLEAQWKAIVEKSTGR